MEVVVLVPVPALRRAVEGQEGAVVVVAVVMGRGLGRLEVVVVGRVRVAVVVGALVMMGGGGGAMVVAGAVPVPATGGNENAFKASSTLTG